MTKGKILAVTLLLAFSFESLANDHSSKYSLDENGIYRIDANNKFQLTIVLASQQFSDCYEIATAHCDQALSPISSTK